jgi:hypothetical protein
MVASGHAFVGHGIIDNVSLLAGSGNDSVCTVYDTDRADTTNTSPLVVLKQIVANEGPIDSAGMPITVSKGAYVELAGTTPRAILNLRRAVGHGSDAAIRTHAFRQ